jgi:hypothetical protein
MLNNVIFYLDLKYNKQRRATMTECNKVQLEFQGINTRKVKASFTGGQITSDGGAIQLRELEHSSKILERFSDCFTDYRNQDLIEHTVKELVSQRVYGLILGYEDLNDHDELRRDRFLSTLVDKSDITGQERRRKQDRGCPLAGKSTLNRLELTPENNSERGRYKKISYDSKLIDDLMVDIFLESYKQPPTEIILDLDATDDPLHGNQEGRFFHGYYRHYCYLPLYIFCGDHLLCARLRPSNIDASKGSVDELARIIGRIREQWPAVNIIIRGDSGFCRDEIMSWCEANGVDYVLGLAKNNRLLKKIVKQREHVRRKHLRTGKACRKYRHFTYRTVKSWSKKRRVVGKAEYLSKGYNPRFVVTSLSKSDYDTRSLYEELYCARGDMENRIKEQQLDMFSDRTSTAQMRANQLRLYFSSLAYIFLAVFRRLALVGTPFQKSQCGTIRDKLLKIGATVVISVRRVFIEFSKSYPYKADQLKIRKNLAIYQTGYS